MVPKAGLEPAIPGSAATFFPKTATHGVRMLVIIYSKNFPKRRVGSKADSTFIAIRIRIFHVPGRCPGDIFTEVSGDHPECHIDARRDAC